LFVDGPQDPRLGQLGAERRPGVDDDVDDFAAQQRCADAAARIALGRNVEFADGDARILGDERFLDLLPHLRVGAALPLQDHQFARQILRQRGGAKPAAPQC
jgi:hypothetical protein